MNCHRHRPTFGLLERQVRQQRQRLLGRRGLGARRRLPPLPPLCHATRVTAPPFECQYQSVARAFLVADAAHGVQHALPRLERVAALAILARCHARFDLLRNPKTRLAIIKIITVS